MDIDSSSDVDEDSLRSDNTKFGRLSAAGFSGFIIW
jgi:hypothetical protein